MHAASLSFCYFYVFIFLNWNDEPEEGSVCDGWQT